MRDGEEIEVIQQEIDYQIQQYRHHRTEASRFLRIAIAFLGIFGAILSGLSEFGSTIPEPPSITPEKAAQAGFEMSDLLSKMIFVDSDLMGELAIQWILLAASVWAVVSILLLGVRVPQHLYRALSIREIRVIPHGTSNPTIEDFRGLLRYNHIELLKIEDSLQKIYGCIRVSLLGITYSGIVYCTVFWEPIPAIALLATIVILPYIGTTSTVAEQLLTEQHPKLDWFDIFPLVYSLPMSLILLSVGDSKIIFWVAVFLLAIFGTLAYIYVRSMEDPLIDWLLGKILAQGALAGVLAVGLLIQSNSPVSSPPLVISLVSLLSYALGTVVLLMVVQSLRIIDFATKDVRPFFKQKIKDLVN